MERRNAGCKRIPGFGTKLAYSVSIPLIKTYFFARAPFEIFQMKCEIELSTASADRVERWHADGKAYEKRTHVSCRPNIYTSTADERDVVFIRDVEELDQSPTYSFVTVSPRVELRYDPQKCNPDKAYCQKMDICFFMDKPTTSIFFSTWLAPLLLVAVLCTLNVLNPYDGAGPSLDSSVGIVFAVVSILPSLKPVGETDGSLTSNDVMILGLFIGVMLTSMRHRNLGPANDFSSPVKAMGMVRWHGRLTRTGLPRAMQQLLQLLAVAA